MTATIIDGKTLVNRISRRIKRESENMRRQYHIEVGLGILLITGDQISMADSGKIIEIAEQSGIKVHTERVAQRNVARKFFPTLEEYANSPFIQGIYIQLPLPTNILSLDEVMRRLPPEKDVAGLHFINRGITTFPPHEVTGRVLPPDVLAVTETLKEAGFELKTGKVVVIGSNATASMVKMLASHLFDQGCNVRLLRYSNLFPTTNGTEARRLRSIDGEVPEESILVNPDGEAVVTWANHPEWLTASRITPHSIVIDVGYRFARGKVSGDCDFVSVSRSANVITPVPGGVRNISHVMVLENLMRLIRSQMTIRDENEGKGIKRKFGL